MTSLEEEMFERVIYLLEQQIKRNKKPDNFLLPNPDFNDQLYEAYDLGFKHGLAAEAESILAEIEGT